MDSLTNAQVRDLKAQAQKLKATLKVGKEGLSPQFLAALDQVLKHRELVKVKFDEFKEQKKELAPQLAEKSRSHLVTRIGNVAVLYQPKPEKQAPKSGSPLQPDCLFLNLKLGSTVSFVSVHLFFTWARRCWYREFGPSCGVWFFPTALNGLERG
jgi:RNA-binding protein